MPFATLLLAAAVRCAEPSYCPTADQLRHAYETWLNRHLAETSEAFAASGDIVMFNPRPIDHVTGVRCGKPVRLIDGAPPAIRCKATLHFYHNGQQKQTLSLARSEQGWAVQERPDSAARKASSQGADAS